MKESIRSIFIFLVTIHIALGLASFSSSTVDDWEIPEKYQNLKNPTDGNDVDEVGAELYKQHCRSCHGREGKGDGPKADELDTSMNDLSSSLVQGQSDGVLYYKSIIGRDEMPNYERKIRSEDERWLVVNYVRSLSK